VVFKLGVSPSRSRLLTGSHRYHPGIVQEAQGRSAETAVSPHHNKQSRTFNLINSENLSQNTALERLRSLTQLSHVVLLWQPLISITVDKL
jgi:hypothetical protein